MTQTFVTSCSRIWEYPCRTQGYGKKNFKIMKPKAGIEKSLN
jgi:hypothetical protein